MIGAFVCVCQEDMGWWPQFIANHATEGIPVVVVADNLHVVSRMLIAQHANVLEVIPSTAKFSERTKQAGLDWLQANGYAWAAQMDIDETWEAGAGNKLRRALHNHTGHLARCPMVQVYDGKWRTDGRCAPTGADGSRARIYNLAHQWRWLDPFTNGAYLMDGNSPAGEGACVEFGLNIGTAHWGYSTQELREAHRAKWERVYGGWGRKEPYGTWAWHCDQSRKPQLRRLPKRFTI